MTLQALGTKIVLERLHLEQTSASGIFLSNTEDPNPPARVISVGLDVKIKVQTGDTVVVGWNNTAQQKYQGKTYWIADETSVYAVENNND